MLLRRIASLIAVLGLSLGMAACEEVLAPFSLSVKIIGPEKALGAFQDRAFDRREAGFVCEYPLAVKVGGGTSQDAEIRWVGASLEVGDEATGTIHSAQNLTVREVERVLGTYLRSGEVSQGYEPLVTVHATLPYAWRLTVLYVDSHTGATREATFSSRCLKSLS